MRFEARSNSLELSLWLLRRLNLADLALYFIITHGLLLYVWWLYFDWNINFIFAWLWRYDRLTFRFLHANFLTILINKESITFEMSLCSMLRFVAWTRRQDIWRRIFSFDLSKGRLFVGSRLCLVKGANSAICTWVWFAIDECRVESCRHLLKALARINTLVSIPLEVNGFHGCEVGTFCLVYLGHTGRCHQHLRSSLNRVQIFVIA